MPATLSKLALVALALAPCLAALPVAQDVEDAPDAQDVEVQRETWPDGSPRIEREVRRDERGEPVLQGEFRSWHRNGQLESEGRYQDGWRSGLWTTWHENGEKASEGAYRLGLRNTRWKYWDEAGELDSELSGSYTAELEEYPSGQRRVGGEYRGKHRHGRWTRYAPDGTVLAEGEYRRHRRDGEWSFYWPASGAVRYSGRYLRDEREGPWVFRHPDGTVDPELLSGVYEDDRRVGGLEVELALPADLSALPEATPASGLHEAERAALAAAVERYAAGGAGREAARKALLDAGRPATPAILARLRALDLAQPADVQVGFHLNYGLLARLWRGHAFEWRPGVTGSDVLANRLTVLRWHSLWEATLDRPEFVAALPELGEGQRESARLFQLPFDPFAASAPLAADAVDPVDPADPLPVLDASERRRLLKKYGGAGTEEALEAALQWLVGHQSTDGSWDADGFSMRCAVAKAKTFCSGGGNPAADVGVTALALSALMGDGSFPGAGPHGEAVQRGIDWLLAQQGADGSLFGERPGALEGIYCHLTSTLALCRALRATGAPELREAVARAVEYTLSKRLAAGGWRYGGAPTETPDTSVTGWALRSLAAARECGIATPPEVEHFALAWLETMTDPQTGRVGYDVAGSASARVPGVNDQFSPEAFETLTATALYARLCAGPEPVDDPLMKKQVSLILKKPPEWSSTTTDLYGWYHATYALYHRGGAAWKRWNAAFRDVLLEAQVTDPASHEQGSFPVDCVWGPSGGRVYTTALAALMLEVYLSGPPRMD